jgi:ubiquinone/menaquinone biosynthesis C-methylase UbiE
MDIYERALACLQGEGSIEPGDRILVTCGGGTDARMLTRRGFGNVLITNLDDDRREGTGSYLWQRCDAEDLPFADNSFDWGIVNAGLHHCRSPHRGLLELNRVSRRGVLVIEARDSLLMRLAVRIGLTPDYEIESVALGTGGMRNGPVPNFIYRWTEREVRKTIESAEPGTVNDLRFYYDLTFPAERLTMCGPAKRLAASIGGLFARALFSLFPRQGNRFAFAVVKTGRTKPWIRAGELDPGYRLGFDPARYVPENVAA